VPTKELRRDKKGAAKDVARLSLGASSATATPEERLTDELFRKLWLLRSTLATRENVAPYMIFAEDTLRQLAVS